MKYIKNIVFLCVVFTQLFCYSQVANQIAYSNFKNRSAELQARILVLQADYSVITNDIFKYKQIYNSIEVPETITKTNTIIICKGSYKTIVKTRKLSTFDRKMMRIVKAFDSEDLEQIYSKYFKEETFSKIKADFKEEYDDILSRYAKLQDNKTIRRNIAKSKAAKINADVNYEIKNKKNELLSDMRKLEIAEKGLKPGALNFESAWRIIGNLEKKYNIKINNYYDVNRLRDILKNQLNSIETSVIFDKKNQIHDINRELAEEDNDELTKETFEQHKLACISKYGDKIESNFITQLDMNARTIASEIKACLETQTEINNLLVIWNDLPEDTITSMNEYIMQNAIKTVLGANFYSDMKKEQALKQYMFEEKQLFNDMRRDYRNDREFINASRKLSLEERRHKMKTKDRYLDLEQKHIEIHKKQMDNICK